MASINIEGQGNLQVPDDFKSWSSEKQQRFIAAAVASKQSNTETSGLLKTPMKDKPLVGVQSWNRGTGENLSSSDVNSFVDEEAMPSAAAENGITPIGDITKNIVADLRSRVPEISALEEAWNELSPEDQNSFIAKSPWVAGAASFLDNILPVPLLWALPDGVEAQVRNAIKENQGTADKAALAGTIVGLIGGPLAVAKIARGGIKVIRKGAVERAGHSSANKLTKWRDEAQTLVNEFKKNNISLTGITAQTAGTISKKVQKEIDDVDDLLRDWYNHIYEQKLSTAEIRDLLQNRVNGLPADHILKRVAGEGGDLMDTIWDLQPKGHTAPTGWIDRIKKNLKYNAEKFKLNTYAESTEILVGVGGDAVANYNYSKNDWKSQGFSEAESTVLALKYVVDRSPKDLAVETLDQILGKGKGAAALRILANTGRAASLLPDLDAETGQVRPDVYGAEAPTGYNEYSKDDFLKEAEGLNRGGLLSSRRGPKKTKRKGLLNI